MEFVITVDEQDRPTGTAEKLAAHQQGTLHRAFSVFIFNKAGELLIQRRAMDKYHSGGLWTNTCCSHPAPGEETLAAAHRRLIEEMGFDTELKYLRPFRYKATVDKGLTENEYDHLYTGTYNDPTNPNPGEVMDYRYLSLPDIKDWMGRAPEAFTAWFRLILPQLQPQAAE